MRKMRATVQSTYWLSADVRALILQPQQPFAYQPGQYAGIARAGGAVRCYSMARAPSNDNGIELHIRRWQGGAFSDLAMRQVAVGDTFDVLGPFGAFAFPSGDDAVVMLATGTGIAPFLAMLEAYLPTNTHRAIHLYWGVREASDLYARATLEAWQARYANFRFTPVLSGRGEGYVQDVAARAMKTPAWTQVLACGNPAMIQDASRRFVEEAATPVAGFASDAFEPAATENAGMDTSKPMITLHIDGQAMPALSDVSLLNALKSAEMPIMSVCGGNASCGTCLVEIEPAWMDRIAPCSRTERNLLACLSEATPTTRLSCQLHLTSELDGLAIRLLSNPVEKESSL